MAKKSIIEREKKRVFLNKKYFDLRNSFKDKIRRSSNLEEKLNFYFQIQKLPKDSASSRLHNRCFVTGRSRSYYRFFGLSRHVLREMAHKGDLPGVVKSSW